MDVPGQNPTPYDVADDVFGIKTLFVNVFFIGTPGPGNDWVLVDAMVMLMPFANGRRPSTAPVRRRHSTWRGLSVLV